MTSKEKKPWRYICKLLKAKRGKSSRQPEGRSRESCGKRLAGGREAGARARRREGAGGVDGQ